MLGSVWYNKEVNKQAGLTLIEILIVVAILGILAALLLAGLSSSQKKAHDTHVKSAVNQLRYIAEIAFSNQGNSYENWTQDPLISDDVITLLEEVDIQSGVTAGPPYVTAIRESQSQDFCVSAPLSAENGVYVCVDASGAVSRSTSECPDYAVDGPPLVCP